MRKKNIMANKNKNLHAANKNKNDEFYTQLSDIEKELGHYKDYFKDKIVFCNCDDPEESNFWNYFALNFEFLGLKKLIATHFEKEKSSYKLELIKDINGDGKINQLDTIKSPLKQNGDFRSPECIEILKESDIVVTNPPFSLFRKYVAQLIEYDKKFIIIGNLNAVTYKETFKLIKENKVWLGATYFQGGAAYFLGNIELFDFKKVSNPKHAYIKDGKLYCRVNGVRWYTNLKIKKRQENLILYKTYNPEEYTKYDNYDAINVDKTKDIPMDYAGIMGVPISFMDKYSPGQFEIIWQACGNTKVSAPKEILERLNYNQHRDDRGGCPIVKGKRAYVRIFIKHKKS